MKITWIGHSCFKIEEGDISVITDPYQDGYVPGLKPLRESASVVICSHQHDDHNAENLVDIVETDLSDLEIELLPSYHDEHGGRDRGKNQIAIIKIGEWKIAHLGDIGCQLDNSQKSRLLGLDAVFIPVGGTYTVDSVGAAEIIAEIKPKVVIPMHYRSDEHHFGFDNIDLVTDFVDKLSAQGYAITVSSESSIELSKEVLKRLYVLEPRDMIGE